MYSLKSLQLKSNKKFKINFKGGDLSSDSGLLLIKAFADKFGFDQVIKTFETDTHDANRIHKDHQNLCQVVFQIIAGYFCDNDADELTHDPVFKHMLDKAALASQPTLSRFWNRMNENSLQALEAIIHAMRAFAYNIKRPEHVLLDLDSTLLNTYGHQEGEGFNYHYQAHGYHPLLCYDGLTGDLLRVQLRQGTAYSCNGVAAFIKPLLDEYQTHYPTVELFLRGDSGFATPALFKQCETHGVTYAIRLKANAVLSERAAFLDDEIAAISANNMIDSAVCYGEFFYQASSWDYPRRVIVKVEKPYGQLVNQHVFIVTNMTLCPENIVRYYQNRGVMENMIKESKHGFAFASTPSQRQVVNQNHVHVHAIAYNLFNYFRRLVLPKHMRQMRVNTIRLKLIKIASKVVRASRYIYFKLCSSCPYKREFYQTLENINTLPQRE